MHKTTDALEILYAHIGDDPEMLEMIRLARISGKAGRLAYELRENAGLTQDELGEKVGQSPEWVDDLEMGDFDGDSLAALQTVARALGANVDAEIERIRAAHPKAGHELLSSVG